MRELTDSERKDLLRAWQDFADSHAVRAHQMWIFDAGFTAGLDHAATQLAAITAERTQLRAESDRLRAEVARLREAQFKVTKDLKRMARDWREHAAGDYCQTYNPEMGRGLRRAAGNLDDYINDTIRLAQEKQNEHL